jgi:hypothetical protein
MTRKPASRETLERLAEAIDLRMRNKDSDLDGCLERYRAETTPPLRTRSEVDAEIVQVVRDCYRTGNLAWLGEDLTGLCRELTLPEPERCPQCLCVGHHQKPCNPERPPVGAGLAVCPCDASQRLHGYLRDILELYDSEGRSWGQVAGVLGRWRGGHP